MIAIITLLKTIKYKYRLIREHIWNRTPYLLHLIDSKISELFFKYNLYPSFIKNKGLRYFPREIVYINPNKIKYYDSERLFSSIYFIQDGDWDKKVIKIEEKPQYRVVNELINKQIPIRQLTDFEYTVNKYLEKKNIGKNQAIDLAVKKYQSILNLIKTMKRDGYKTQEDLGKLPHNKFNTWYDEIRVSINRNGEYLLNGSGNHRLFISQQIGIEKVPIVIIRNHYQFINHI